MSKPCACEAVLQRYLAACGYGRPLQYPPERCPWCGAGLAGGGEHTAYYDCAAHIWTLAGGRLAGHPGGTAGCPMDDEDDFEEIAEAGG